MRNGVESPFQRAMSRSNNRTRLGMNTLLAWVAASDGTVTQSEHKLLREFAGQQQASADLDLALDIVRELESDDLMLACDVVRDLSCESSRAFMQWAISVATSDNKLAIPTNYILRFFADLISVDLDETYRQVTTKTLPMPGDASSIDWWQMREAAAAGTSGKAKSGKAKSHHDPGKKKASRAQKSGLHMTQAQALAVLGLEQNASAGEIAEAFRQLAHVHHPDRFSQSGPEVQRSASSKFARIREAFEVLTQE